MGHTERKRQLQSDQESLHQGTGSILLFYGLSQCPRPLTDLTRCFASAMYCGQCSNVPACTLVPATAFARDGFRALMHICVRVCVHVSMNI